MTSSNEKIVEEELNNDTESQMQDQYDDLRLSKLGFRIRLARAINMLGANGISLSLWGVFIAILVFRSARTSSSGSVCKYVTLIDSDTLNHSF